MYLGVVMTVGIKDIADNLGVSFSCVSKALNNASDIGLEMKERVQKEAERVNYRPNLLARGLAGGSTRTIGYVIPNIEDVFSPAITRKIEAGLKAENYFFVLSHSNNDGFEEGKIVRNMLAMRVQGFIIIPAAFNLNLDIYRYLAEQKIPFVLIDAIYEELDANMIASNDCEASEEAVTYLISRGYRRIGFISGPRNHPNMKARLTGYKTALKKAGISADEKYIHGESYKRESGYSAGEYFALMSRKPDAVFCCTDEMAIGAYNSFKSKGIQVPKDIALMGFGGMPALEKLDIKLSTVSQPKGELGDVAVQVLIESIEGGSANWKPKRVILKSKLEIGEST